jgi:tetratricopeptide (TPR) repeat protein
MLHCFLVITLVFCVQQTDDAAAHFARGVELQRDGELRQAAAEYRIAITAKPNYVEALANLGSVLSRLGEYQESVRAYEQALKIAPNLNPLLLNLGIAHHRAGVFEKAVQAFAKVLAAAPDSVQARQLLGVSLVELGRDAEAIPHLEISLASSPGDTAVLYSLGLAYLRVGRRELPQIIDRLARQPAGLAASHLLSGQRLLAGGEYERSISELNVAEKLNPALPRLHYSLGLALLKLGRNADALASLKNELNRTPRDFSTLYYVAYLHELQGDIDAARERLDAALRLDASSPEANSLLGKILLKQNRAAEAIAPLELAVKGDPKDPDKRYLLGRSYQQTGRREDAAREFAEVQRLKAEQLEHDRARTPKPM